MSFATGYYTRVFICPDCKRIVPPYEIVYNHDVTRQGILDHTVCEDCHNKIEAQKR